MKGYVLIRFLPVIAIPFLPLNLRAQDKAPNDHLAPAKDQLKPVVVQAHAFAETPELTKLGPGQPVVAPDAEGTGRVVPIHYFRRSPKAQGPRFQRDPVIQSSAPTLNTPSPSLSFDGVNNNCSCTPPDPNGAVGPSNYVSIVNNHFQVFNKFTGAAQTSIATISTLFSSLGGGSLCATTDDGDPIVVYDQLADRWLISQFANAASTTGPWYMSVAISKTPNPTGAYYAYCFQVPSGRFPDYPKFGVWSDGYYMTDNQFNGAGTAYLGVGVFAFDRAKMLAGDPTASYIYFNLDDLDSTIFGMLPGSVDGPPPPVGTPNYFTYYTATENGDAQDGLRVFQFHADFVQTNLATFAERPESPITVASFNPIVASVPQSGTSRALDTLSDRLMFRLQYRNFRSNESLVVTHTVVGGSAQAAVRYYQLKRNLPSGNFTVNEQATFAPTSQNRWMGSAAMNYRGDLAVGYSCSSSTNFPSIRYAARLASDPPNGLFQGEAVLIEGGGSQTSTGLRWGDYSCLTVDPSDDCTFWYTTEYYATTSTGSWRTRVGSFTLPGCAVSPRATIQGTVSSGLTGLPLSNALVRTASGYVRVTGAAGTYSMTVAPGTNDMSAVFPGLGTNSVTNVIVTNGQIRTQNFVIGAPTMIVVGNGATLTAEGCVAANGVIDPAETVTVNFALHNVGTANASNVVATLQATGGVTAPSGPQSYGLLGTNGATTVMPFTFTATGFCGGSLTATLALTTNAVNAGSVTFGFNLGTTVAATKSLTNSTAITIPGSGTGAATGAPASVYPSTITVASLGGTVTKMTVTLNNLSHSFPDDIDVLLVGPTGKPVVLMSDTGAGTDISNVTLTFDDAAASQLPDATAISAGTYRPTNIGSGDPFPAPATTNGLATTLAAYNGLNPNGTWSLYIVDDASVDTGSLGAGWILKITTTSNACCTGVANQPPVINAASISPASPMTTNILVASVTSSNDPNGDPITLAYQWQESTNDVNFGNIAFTSSMLPAAVTVAGDYYRVVITPNDTHVNGSPFTTASVLVALDSDSNGLNDDWEFLNFGHLGVDPNEDADGDGFSNSQEFTAGTNPNSTDSEPQITSVVTSGADVLVSFDTISGKKYELQRADDLVNPTWDVIATDIAGTGGSVEITDTNGASQSPRYYRVRLMP